MLELYNLFAEGKHLFNLILENVIKKLEVGRNNAFVFGLLLSFFFFFSFLGENVANFVLYET